MPRNLSDETFDALTKIVRQIDLRAKRLLEWRILGFNTQLSETRFELFHTRLKNASDPPSRNELDELNIAWQDCDRNLIELGLLPDSFEAITVFLINGTADPTVKEWINKLVAAGLKVKQDLARKSFGDLSKHTTEYKEQYMKLNIQRDAKVQFEITQLAALTNELRLKFE